MWQIILRWFNGNISDPATLVPVEIEMLVDDPKDYEELSEMALDQELCIHITEDMLTMSPDQTNGYTGTNLPQHLCSALIHNNTEIKCHCHLQAFVQAR